MLVFFTFQTFIIHSLFNCCDDFFHLKYMLTNVLVNSAYGKFQFASSVSYIIILEMVIVPVPISFFRFVYGVSRVH